MAALVEHIPTTMESMPHELLVTTLSYLEPGEVDGVAALLSPAHRDASREPTMWAEACAASWRGYRLEAAWLEAAETAGWRAQYIAALADTWQALPVFAMSARLRLGEGVGLHFFEPRYRWLVQLTLQRPQGVGPRALFCWCPHQPQPDAPAFICELSGHEVYQDGRADVQVTPIANCIIQSAWTEPVPNAPHQPALCFAQCEEVPLDSAAAASAGGGGGGEDGEDEDARVLDVLRHLIADPELAEQMNAPWSVAEMIAMVAELEEREEQA